MRNHCIFILFTLLFLSKETQSQKLIVYNGFLEKSYFIDNEKVSAEKFNLTISQNELSALQWKKSLTNEAFGTAFTVVGAGFALWGLTASIGTKRNSSENIRKKRLAFVGAVSASLFKVYFSQKSKNARNSAIDEFNSHSESIFIQPFILPNGAGLVLSF